MEKDHRASKVYDEANLIRAAKTAVLLLRITQFLTIGVWVQRFGHCERSLQAYRKS